MHRSIETVRIDFHFALKYVFPDYTQYEQK